MTHPVLNHNLTPHERQLHHHADHVHRHSLSHDAAHESKQTVTSMKHMTAHSHPFYTHCYQSLCSNSCLCSLPSLTLTTNKQKDEVYLNLVLEFIPETVYRVARHYNKQKQTIPISFIKLYMYQLFRSLAYIHSLGICHRDIKPQNLLLDPDSGVLKLCDFGRCVF